MEVINWFNLERIRVFTFEKELRPFCAAIKKFFLNGLRYWNCLSMT